MKRALLILVVATFGGIAAYAWAYRSCTSECRALLASEKPELTWLKEEFKLSDSEFKKVSELHASYLPHCREMCQRVEEKTAEAHRLLVGAEKLSPELSTALNEAAQMRLECQKDLLKHFFEVADTMPAAQKSRYLAWVTEKAFLPDHGMVAH